MLPRPRFLVLAALLCLAGAAVVAGGNPRISPAGAARPTDIVASGGDASGSAATSPRVATSTQNAAGMPGGAVNGHYIVFEQDGTGRIRALFHRRVKLAAPLRSLDAQELLERLSRPSRQTDMVEVDLEDARGFAVYQDVVDTQRWMRGEFHGAGGSIDGHILPLDSKVFVVRVPEAAGTKLVVRPKGSAATTFDPEGLAADATLPLAGVSGALAQAVTPPPANPQNRVDLLIMGDGYTAAESGKFASDASTLENDFFSITPYMEYRNFVNVSTIFTASAQSGADHPPYNADCAQGAPSCCADPEMQSDPLAGTVANTAFDATYCTYNIHRLLTVNTSLVLAAASAAPDWDSIMVIVNDATYGGSGGYLSVASTNPFAAEIAQHEYGHSFTRLADEYSSPYPGYPTCSDISGPVPCEVNVTDQSTRALVKWLPWIHIDTPVPTPQGTTAYADVVGLFEGARYLSSGMYRPGDTCLMRSLGGYPFCQVASQAYVLKLYDGGWGTPSAGIDLIEPGSESPPPGLLAGNTGPINFNVSLLQPSGAPPLAVNWYVNDVVDPANHSSSFGLTPVPGSTYEVRVEVTDTTPLVHPAMASTSLTSSRLWTIEPRLPASIDLTASPAGIVCDGIQTSAVTAYVTDAFGDPVDDSTSVTFSVIGDGVPYPAVTSTSGGVAGSTITPAATAGAGVSVHVVAALVEASIDISCLPPPNPDNSWEPLDIVALPFTDARNTAGTSLEAGEPQPCGDMGATIWYRLNIAFPPPGWQSIAVDTVGSDFNTAVAVYVPAATSPPGGLTIVDCNANASHSSVYFTTNPGATYFVQVGGQSGATGNLVVNADQDTDGDGYTDKQEIDAGKDPTTYCGIMRGDVNGSGKVSLADLILTAQQYNQAIPPARERYNQNGDAKITLADLILEAQVYNQPLTACP